MLLTLINYRQECLKVFLILTSMEDVFLEKLVFRNLTLCVGVLVLLNVNATIPVPAWSKAWVCGSLIAVNAGSNSFGNMYVCLLWVLRFVK
jgi:hypothetical protein